MTNLLTLVNLQADRAAILQGFAMEPIKKNDKMQINRRSFFKICAGGLAGTSAALLGFAPTTALASVREFKLIRARETRNNCTYCSVGCGMLIYSLVMALKMPAPRFTILKATLTIRSVADRSAPKVRACSTLFTVNSA